MTSPRDSAERDEKPLLGLSSEPSTDLQRHEARRLETGQSSAATWGSHRNPQDGVGQADLLGVCTCFYGRAGRAGREHRGRRQAQQAVTDSKAGSYEVSSQRPRTWGPRQPLKASHRVVVCLMQSMQGK